MKNCQVPFFGIELNLLEKVCKFLGILGVLSGSVLANSPMVLRGVVQMQVRVRQMVVEVVLEGDGDYRPPSARPITFLPSVLLQPLFRQFPLPALLLMQHPFGE